MCSFDSKRAGYSSDVGDGKTSLYARVYTMSVVFDRVLRNNVCLIVGFTCARVRTMLSVYPKVIPNPGERFLALYSVSVRPRVAAYPAVGAMSVYPRRVCDLITHRQTGYDL